MRIDPTHPRIRAVLWVTGSVAAVSLVMGMIVGVLAIYGLTDATRQTQISNTQRSADTKAAAEQAARSADRIEDCTTPGRPCFEDAQKRLGRTVADINRYALAAAVCADQPQTQTVDEIQRCIIDVIAERPPGPRLIAYLSDR